MYYGDPFVDTTVWTQTDSSKVIAMSTAIVRVFTDEGFVIAADGIAIDEHGVEISRREKKIFPITM